MESNHDHPRLTAFQKRVEGAQRPDMRNEKLFALSIVGIGVGFLYLAYLTEWIMHTAGTNQIGLISITVISLLFVGLGMHAIFISIPSAYQPIAFEWGADVVKKIEQWQKVADHFNLRMLQVEEQIYTLESRSIFDLAQHPFGMDLYLDEKMCVFYLRL